MKYLFLFLSLFLSLSLLLWNVSTTISKGYRERAKFEQISREVSEKEAEVEALKSELAFAQSDQAAEGGARDVLGMSYPGEEVVFVDERNLEITPDEADEGKGLLLADAADASRAEVNFSSWMKLFFY